MSSPRDALLECRLLIDPPASGFWQMAADETLLDSAAAGTPTLRFYEWSEPTLSLGYFQAQRDRALHRSSRDYPLVRRQTGGGAILHDRELTYSLALPLAHPLAADAMQLYLAAHRALIDTLGSLGIEAQLRTPGEAARKVSDLGIGAQAVAPVERNVSEPFLCFQRAAEGDVLFAGTKICGSAQRRRRGAILQHGSLLLAASPAAPELAGLLELTGNSPSPTELIAPWSRELAFQLRLHLRAAPLDETERERVRTLAVEKYDTAAWNRRR